MYEPRIETDGRVYRLGRFDFREDAICRVVACLRSSTFPGLSFESFEKDLGVYGRAVLRISDPQRGSTQVIVGYLK
jgi:hypothetical protein